MVPKVLFCNGGFAVNEINASGEAGCANYEVHPLQKKKKSIRDDPGVPGACDVPLSKCHKNF